MSERVERLDRSMDFVLVLLSIISAALFQFVTALPYNPSEETEVSAFAFNMRFSLKLLFLPFLPLILMWLSMHVVQNENQRMLLREMVWAFATTAMALNVVVLFILGLPLKMQPLKYPDIVPATLYVGGIFGLFFIFDVIVARAYTRAMMMDARAPAHEFFFERRWRYYRIYASFVLSLLWYVILLGSIS